MAPLKKHPDPSGSSQNHQKKAKRRRPSNKVDLIYKYLGNLCDLKGESAENSKRNSHQKKDKKREQNEDAKCTNSAKSFKDLDLHEGTSDEEEYDDCASESSSTSSKGDSKEDSKISGEMKIKSYVRKALDIGVQNGYLIPADTTCRVLRVASDLVELENRKRKHEQSHSSDIQGENNEVQDRKKRRRSKGRRSRRRKKSRSRGRRRMSKNEESEEMADDDEDEEKSDDQGDQEEHEKKKKLEEDDKRSTKNTKSNPPDRDNKEIKKEENSEDECSDEEPEKKI